MTRPDTQARLEDALSRLLAGQPVCTDGQLTVTNLCREAGVGRDSYYRTPGMADRFEAAKANAAAREPELVLLRQRVRDLERQLKATRRDHSAALRTLEETVQTYANQIQALALHATQLHDRNAELQHRLQQTTAITTIGPAPAAPLPPDHAPDR